MLLDPLVACNQGLCTAFVLDCTTYCSTTVANHSLTVHLSTVDTNRVWALADKDRGSRSTSYSRLKGDDVRLRGHRGTKQLLNPKHHICSPGSAQLSRTAILHMCVWRMCRGFPPQPERFETAKGTRSRSGRIWRSSRSGKRMSGRSSRRWHANE